MVDHDFRGVLASNDRGDRLGCGGFLWNLWILAEHPNPAKGDRGEEQQSQHARQDPGAGL